VGCVETSGDEAYGAAWYGEATEDEPSSEQAEVIRDIIWS
jgi:hypothetical protein